MWMFRRRRRDPRNILFDAALEFGKYWRYDLGLLANERLRDLSADECADLAGEIGAARTAIEEWISDRWESVSGEWSRDDSAAAESFIRDEYPWMDDRNVSHAVSQGTYYAWHG